MNRPLFARIQARASATEERKGGAEYRRRLLAGLRGRVIEVGAGSGVNFVYYPSGVVEVVAVEPELNLRVRAVEAARQAPVPVRVIAGVAQRLLDATVWPRVFGGCHPTATRRRPSLTPASPSRPAIASCSTRRCCRYRSPHASSAARDGCEPCGSCSST